MYYEEGMNNIRYSQPPFLYPGIVVQGPNQRRFTNPKNVPMFVNNCQATHPAPTMPTMPNWNCVRPHNFNYKYPPRYNHVEKRYGNYDKKTAPSPVSNKIVNTSLPNDIPDNIPTTKEKTVTSTRDSQSQTDFPKEIADLHLKELPNTLYLSNQNKKTEKTTDNNKDNAKGVADHLKHHTRKHSYEVEQMLRRNNVISSGTHPISQPVGDQVKVNTVMSYSMVAQKPPVAVPKPSNPPQTTAEGNVSDPDQNTAEGTGTKKKRKRNRKKKKTANAEEPKENLDLRKLEDEVAELNIHLEDEMEFPDLWFQKKATARNDFRSTSHPIPPATENNQGIFQNGSDPENAPRTESISFTGDDGLPFKQVNETKSARKRRKRHDQANQAANEEMAEITIEQQMLQELGLKAKLEQTATKDQQTPAQTKQKGSKNNRKSTQPIALDFSAMITALEQKRDEAVAIKNAPKKPAPRKKYKPEVEPPRKPHNPLDSSCPKVKRGKEREFPKPKKPSPLKKVILKEREEKKRLRLLEEDPSVGADGGQVCVGVVNTESDLSQDGEDRTKGSMSAELSPISQTSPFSMSPLSPSASPLHSGFNSPVAKDASNPALLKIHSRRYREYCTQILDKDIDNCCLRFLQNLVRYQDKQYHKDPRKAKSRRRIVLGLREVAKHLKLKKIKCVIISPNLEKIQSKGGLDDALNNILNMCTEQEIPFVFALGRRALGRACAKLVPVSVVGVFNYDGSEKHFWRLIELTQKATDSYKEMVSVVEKDLQENPNNRIGPANAPNLFAHMGHSRTPSGCSAISFTSSILSEPISENYPYSEPETDSKGFEVNKHRGSGLKAMQSSMLNEQTAVIDELDAGNEADTEDFVEAADSSEPCKSTNSLDDQDPEEDDPDNVEDLPYIDSIHYSNYELSVVEILSQHSSRTIENSEAMSTHSSKTLRDGSPTIFLEKYQERHNVVGTLSTPHKVIDKDRIQSWVETTQSCTEDPQGESACSADEASVNKAADGDLEL